MKQENEIRFDVRIKNNLLCKAREALGLSPPQAARASGVNYHQWLDLESVKMSARSRKTGKWRPAAEKIAEFFKCTPDMLWPESLDGITTNRLTFDAPAHQLKQLSASLMGEPALLPDSVVECRQRNEAIAGALGKLNKQQREVLVRRFGLGDRDEQTQAEIAKELCLSTTRVGQVERDALRRIRETSKHGALSVFGNSGT